MKTIEEKLAVMRGWLEGKEIEMCVPSGIWVPAAHYLHWNWDEFIYRIKPEPAPKRRVPLGPDDLPTVCWVRLALSSAECLVTTIDQHGIVVVGPNQSVERLFWGDAGRWEYSPDRKNWKPMWKEVE